jgi:hypothetical protein
MAGKTRKTNFFKRVYSPVKHAIMASKETVGALTNTTRGVACSGLSGLNRIGSSVATHANMAANDLLGRRTRRHKRNTRRGKKAGRR